MHAPHTPELDSVLVAIHKFLGGGADISDRTSFLYKQTNKQTIFVLLFSLGNLPANSKCQTCKKTCWSAECLAGMRCEWCGIAAHATCYKLVPSECNFGVLESIMLPPAAVSIPRTDVPLETIIGAYSPYHITYVLSIQHVCPRCMLNKKEKIFLLACTSASQHFTWSTELL